jgi:hypothetical protein
MRFAGIDIGDERHAIAVVNKPAWYWSSQRSLERTQRDTNACGTFSAIRTIVWWRWGRRGTIGVTCSRSWWDTALVTLLNPFTYATLRRRGT